MAGLRKTRLALLFALAGSIGLTVVFAAPSPPSPLPIRDAPEYTTLDVQVHERGSITSLPAINAQHGADCSAPPATHANTSFEGSVFVCGADANRHVMTAINGAEYGLIVLTPNLLFDFSHGGSVTWEMSTEKMSVRDWWDVTVSPFMDAQALPLLSSLSQGVDLQEPNRNSIVVATDNGEGGPALKVVRNGVVTCPTKPNGNCWEWSFNRSANEGVTAANQAATRQPFKLTVTPTRIRFERLATATGSAVVFFDQAIPALNFTQGVVQFGHHSYDPEKDGAGVPATWHWDNFDAQPSTPFTIEHTSTRAIFGSGTLTYPSAPSGAYLRFSALCKPVINNQPLNPMTDSGHREHAASYMVAVEPGSTAASVSFIQDTTGTCHLKDAHVWALTTSIATATPVDSTSTPTATNTATATPTATATATIAPPTPTRTPTPQTYRCQRRNPNGTWTTVWSGAGRACP